jgi:hypothetical protein
MNGTSNGISQRPLRVLLFFIAGLSLIAFTVIAARIIGYEPFIGLGASRTWFEYEMFDYIDGRAVQLFVVVDFAILALLVPAITWALRLYGLNWTWADLISAINPVSATLAYVVARSVINDDRVAFIDMGKGGLIGALFGSMLLIIWVWLVIASRAPKPIGPEVGPKGHGKV